MIRLTALTLIVIIIAVQLSTTECKKDKEKKKNKGCKFNMKAYKSDETILTDEDQCVALVCRQGKKGKPRKKDKGKGKKKKFSIVPEPIADCTPTKCMDMPCSGGRCLPPIQDECSDADLVCPTEWDCTAEKYTDPDTGCTKCRCDLNDPQYESKCGPSKPRCPMDCGVKIIVNQETGCTECICDPDDNSNPFGPDFGDKDKDKNKDKNKDKDNDEEKPSKAVSWNDGCNDCTCMNGAPVCTLKGCVEDNTTDEWPICKNGCSREMVLVCGTNGVTYNNSCMLDFDRICNEKDVQFSHAGSCECKACNKRKYDPVCGDDCVTYSNACVLRFENCINKKNVKQVQRGSCEGGKKKPGRPKRGIHSRTERMVQKKKEKKKKGKNCEYNGKRYKVDSEVDLGIHCAQLKCIKKGKKPALEIQSKKMM